MAYQKILLALELSNYSNELCIKAQDLAKRYHAQLGLIHVVEPVVVEYAYDALPVIPVGLDQELQKRARKELLRLADRSGVPEQNCWVEVGSTKHEILRVAKEQAFDLIVVGSHGRHGVALLLGSTANAVLHGAHCDVLAMRVN